MKLITAIMRPEKLDELIDVIVANRANGLTVTEVRGFGKQFGQFAASQADTDFVGAEWAADRKVALLSKIRLDILVLDDDTETMVEAIAKRARTERIGDGKIWVTTVNSAMRVRTGERDRAAV